MHGMVWEESGREVGTWGRVVARPAQHARVVAKGGERLGEGGRTRLDLPLDLSWGTAQ